MGRAPRITEPDVVYHLMQWVTVTHTHRWHAHHHTIGKGPLYQGRFKCFPVEEDRHFLTVCRYVEANAVRAGLADRAEDWRWCSLWSRQNRGGPLNARLAAWPVDRPRGWRAAVNRPLAEDSLKKNAKPQHGARPARRPRVSPGGTPPPGTDSPRG